MSINGAFNQLAIAIAAIIGGLLVGEKVDGQITSFWLVGVFSTCITLFCIWVCFKIKTVS